MLAFAVMGNSRVYAIGLSGVGPVSIHIFFIDQKQKEYTLTWVSTFQEQNTFGPKKQRAKYFGYLIVFIF